MTTIEREIQLQAERLGVRVDDAAAAHLATFVAELLRWNRHINLTAITEPSEVVEKHVVDSLAALPDLASELTSVLDLGAGAGFPGVVWAIARPDLQVTLVDAVGKKVAFMKAVAARLGLTSRVRVKHAHLSGRPAQEGVPRAQVVVSRAFMEVGAWLALAKEYVEPNGQVMSFMARAPEPQTLVAVGAPHGLRFVTARAFELPVSRDPRVVASWQLQPVHGSPSD